MFDMPEGYYWVLNPDHSVRPATSREEALEFFGTRQPERQVAETQINPLIRVSTVFLIIDHSFGGGPPILFETMVFGLPDDSEPQWRYRSWDEAQAGHDQVVAAIVQGVDLDTLEIE
jgi:hypothetical protein